MRRFTPMMLVAACSIATVAPTAVQSLPPPLPLDMARIFTTPAPAQGPVPPIPDYASVNCTFQLMRALSVTASIDDFNRTGSYLCSPLSDAAKNGKGKGRLLLFFTGTAPSDNTLFIQTAATLGFHAVGRCRGLHPPAMRLPGVPYPLLGHYFSIG